MKAAGSTFELTVGWGRLGIVADMAFQGGHDVSGGTFSRNGANVGSDNGHTGITLGGSRTGRSA